MMEVEDGRPESMADPENEPGASGAVADDAHITRIVEEYRAAVHAGQRPDRQAILARCPEIADALAECFDALDFIENAVPQLHDSAWAQRSDFSSPAAEVQPEGPLGDFRIIREIGRGGMGVVYEAMQISLGRRVALKVLPFAAALDTKQLQRFKNEAQAAAFLQHTNIVPVYYVGCERGVHFYAMQYIEGQTLAASIQELRANVKGPMTNDERMTRAEARMPKGPPPGADAQTDLRHSTLGLLSSLGIRHSSFFRTVANLGVQAAEALEHAHQQDIVHRDIKPANLLIDAGGRLWITDFGLAHCQSQPRLTMTGDVLGTLRYMSPEQALAKRVAADARTDTYSLGVTFYELVTLEPAYNGRDREELLRQIALEEPRPPGRLNPAVPAELETILLKAMAKIPEERYATAQELADDLRRFLEDKSIKARRPSLRQRAAKWARRHKTVVRAGFVVLGLAMAALAVSTILIWQSLKRERQTSYYQRIALAEREWSANNLGRMEQLLEECPADLRGWEWDYLKRLPYQTLLPLEHGSAVTSVAYSPSGQYLASAGRDGIVKVWDLHNGQPVRTFRAGEKMVFRVGFSPDGERLAAACSDGNVIIWDMHSARQALNWKAHPSTIHCVQFSPDGQLLASSCLSYGWEGEPTGGEVKVWNAANAQEIFTFKGQPLGVLCVGFSPDGRLIASAGEEPTVKVWETTTGRVLWTSPLHTAPVHAVTFTPDGRFLASAGADWHKLVHAEVMLWDMRTGKERFALKGHIGYLLSLAFSPNGRRLASAGMDRTIKLWDVETGRETLTLRGHKGTVFSVAFSPDGHQLASGAGDQTVRVWDARPITENPGEGPLTLRVNPPGVLGVAFHPDGQKLATVADAGGVQLWDSRTGTRILTFPESRGFVSVAISPDGQRLAAGGEGEMSIWDVGTGRKLYKLRGFANTAYRLVFTPDSRMLVSVHWDKTLRLWDMTTGKEVDHFRAHDFAIHGLALSPDGKLTVTAGVDEKVKVWELATRKLIKILQPPHPIRVRCVAFRPDGQLLASASGEGTITLWDTQMWKQHGDDLHDPIGGVEALAFSPDGRLLAWGSMDSTVKVWDTVTKEIHSLRGHTSCVECVAFSPDGKTIASASLDGTVKLWPVTFMSEAGTAPRRAPGLAPQVQQ